MAGLIFYFFTSLGFSLFFPGKDGNRFPMAGTNLLAGYCLSTIFLFIFAAVAGFDNQTAVFLVLAMAAAGMVHGIRKWWTGDRRFHFVLSPAFLLFVAGGATIAALGGIDYLPTTNDEFTNWLGAARLIHFAGDFDAAKGTLNHAGYPPGWRLLLMAPWQVGGRVDAGLSAAAPFVLHAIVIALIYDLVRYWLSSRLGLEDGHSTLYSWGVVLLFLAAQGMGRLWPLYLLIEPPQVYTYGAFLVLLVAIASGAERERQLWLTAGLTLALSFLFKVAAIGLLAGVLAVLLIQSRFWRKPLVGILNDSGINTVLVSAPFLVVAVAWHQLAPPAPGCFGAPASAIENLLAAGGTRNATDLSWRMGSAIWEYVAEYKIGLTVPAVIGMALAFVFGKARGALLAFCVFAAVYFLALYLFHLYCWGDYEYARLESIPRYARVVVQALHALGIVLLVFVFIEGGSDAWKSRIGGLLRARLVLAIGLTLVALLGALQVFEISRTVIDVSKRSIWGIDPRIAEMKSAAAFIERQRQRFSWNTPHLLIINQDFDGTSWKYAFYFAQGRSAAGKDERYTVHRTVSWSPQPKNIWQTETSAAALAETFLAADVIWPIRTDEFVENALRKAGVDPTCVVDLAGKAIVRRVDGSTVSFQCIAKDEAVP